MSKHTPGPWSFGHSGMDSLWVGPSADVLRVAAVDWDCATARDEARANARLIAAAPTMHDYIEKLAAAGDSDAAEILEAINAGR